METIRDHYPLTLRLWLARLDEHWDDAVASIGLGRARVWKLYMTGSILAFEENRLQIHHVTSVRPPESGESGMALRPDWE
jgi:cyclopropane-fatty-acyl-phospholipid synthase